MQPLLKDDDGGRVGYISRIVLLSRSNTWQVSCATKVQPLTREMYAEKWPISIHRNTYMLCY